MKTFFVWLIGKITAFLVDHIVYKAALITAIITATLLAIGVLWAGLMGLKASLVAVTLDDPWMQVGLTAVLPWNFELCISVMAAARSLDWLWRINLKIFENIVAVERAGMPKIGW